MHSDKEEGYFAKDGASFIKDELNHKKYEWLYSKEVAHSDKDERYSTKDKLMHKSDKQLCIKEGLRYTKEGVVCSFEKHVFCVTLVIDRQDGC